jgi:hypothetical protein
MGPRTKKPAPGVTGAGFRFSQTERLGLFDMLSWGSFRLWGRVVPDR